MLPYIFIVKSGRTHLIKVKLVVSCWLLYAKPNFLPRCALKTFQHDKRYIKMCLLMPMSACEDACCVYSADSNMWEGPVASFSLYCFKTPKSTTAVQCLLTLKLWEQLNSLYTERFVSVCCVVIMFHPLLLCIVIAVFRGKFIIIILSFNWKVLCQMIKPKPVNEHDVMAKNMAKCMCCTDLNGFW